MNEEGKYESPQVAAGRAEVMRSYQMPNDAIPEKNREHDSENMGSSYRPSNRMQPQIQKDPAVKE